MDYENYGLPKWFVDLGLFGALYRMSNINSDLLRTIITMWDRPHTPYHNLEHLREGLLSIQDWTDKTKYDRWMQDALIAAWFVHDAIYDITSKTNEEDSAQLLDLFGGLDDKTKNLAKRLVMATKDHTKDFVKARFQNSSELSEKEEKEEFEICTLENAIVQIDLERLTTSHYNVMVWVEKAIRIEYGMYPIVAYREGRIKILKSLRETVLKINPNSQIDNAITYLENWTPTVGVLVGSFNPFHSGHLDLLTQAEEMFDEVHVGVGINPSKPAGDYTERVDNIKSILVNRHVFQYNTTTVELLKNMETYEDCIPVLVRGVRNAADMEAEKSLLLYNRYIYPKMRQINFITNGFVSSSGLRDLQKIGTPDVMQMYNNETFKGRQLPKTI